MAWCPLCKKEYDDALTQCDDCNVLLLKGIETDYDTLLSDKSEETILNAYTYLVENGFEAVQYYSDNDGISHLLINNSDYEDAYNAISMLLGEELLKIEDNDITIEDAPKEHSEKAKPYIKPSDKLAELNSSAASLLFVGILGIIFLLMEYFNVFNLNLTSTAHTIFYIVMSSLFIIFIITGIISFVNAVKLKPVAIETEKKTNDILDFTTKNYNKENAEKSIELFISQRNITPDDLFFFYQRVSIIKELITNNFEITDESYLDYLIDEAYSRIYDDSYDENIDIEKSLKDENNNESEDNTSLDK